MHRGVVKITAPFHLFFLLLLFLLIIIIIVLTPEFLMNAWVLDKVTHAIRRAWLRQCAYSSSSSSSHVIPLWCVNCLRSHFVSVCPVTIFVITITISIDMIIINIIGMFIWLPGLECELGDRPHDVLPSSPSFSLPPSS